MKLLWIGEDCRDRRTIEGWDVCFAPSRGDIAEELGRHDPHAILIHSADGQGVSGQLLEMVFRFDTRLPVVVHLVRGTLDDAISLTRYGVAYVLQGELQAGDLATGLRKAVQSAAPRFYTKRTTPLWRELLIGESRPMLEVCAMVELVASKRCTVLITGATGTGKEVVAKAIHSASPRAQHSMVSVNCTALPASLIETELFGHAKGAFTGAYAGRTGRFEQAHRGTIFLDEIGDLPIESQAKLLRVLQEQEFERVGSSETVRVDVRVVAASNVDLEAASRERKFREDLFYRLNVVPIQMPPLSERREDIPLLVDHFVKKISTADDAVPKLISKEALEYLQSLDWPGNVRQLEHSVQMAFALSGERRLLYPNDFQARRKSWQAAGAAHSREFPQVTQEGLDFDEAVAELERALLTQALTLSRGNKARAAELLRIKRTTLLAKLKVLNGCAETEPAGASGPRRLQVIPRRPSALVVEPDETIRTFVTGILQRRNVRVLEAKTEQDAFELIQCWAKNISLLVTSEESWKAFDQFRFDLGTVVLRETQEKSGRPAPDTRFLTVPFSADEFIDALDELKAQQLTRERKLCA